MAGRRAADLYPSLEVAYPDLVFSEFDPATCHGLDLVFLGLPHGASMELAPSLVGQVGCVVDLSAAFRLKDPTAYPTFYGFEHTQLDLLAEAVFGLPELHRDELNGARLVATPGCHVTAATLALRPLVEAGLIETTGVIVDTLTGITGAGRGRPTPACSPPSTRTSPPTGCCRTGTRRRWSRRSAPRSSSRRTSSR